MLAGAVHNDSGEPRPQGGVAAEAPQRPERAAPSLLEHVRGVGVPAAQQPHRETEEDGGVAPIQLAKRNFIAFGQDSFYELGIRAVRHGAGASHGEEPPRTMTIPDTNGNASMGVDRT